MSRQRRGPTLSVLVPTLWPSLLRKRRRSLLLLHMTLTQLRWVLIPSAIVLSNYSISIVLIAFLFKRLVNRLLKLTIKLQLWHNYIDIDVPSMMLEFLHLRFVKLFNIFTSCMKIVDSELIVVYHVQRMFHSSFNDLPVTFFSLCSSCPPSAARWVYPTVLSRANRASELLSTERPVPA